jgi:asparagine synthase (glutamine-hydrolysing)
MDQPSIDGFNTFVISRVAHEVGFKVVLSGLGGDELFGGYTSFRDVPSWLRAARRMAAIPGMQATWPRLIAPIRSSRPKLAGFLTLGRSLPGAYFLRRGLFLPGEIASIVGDDLAREGLAEYDPIADAGKDLDAELEDWAAVHRMESTMYMRNQLLRDSDWASMAHSLELRVPLVDAWLEKEVSSMGFQPARETGKAATFRRIVPELPAAIWDRRKTGFAVPVRQWLEESDRSSRPGLDSRTIAVRVLEAFGIESATPTSRLDARAATL